MTEAKTVRPRYRRSPNWRTGAVSGVVGGLAYTVLIEAVTVASDGVGAFFHPLRQIGAVVLGARALDADYDVLTAAAVGTVVHLAIAAAFGVVIAWIAARLSMSSVVGLIALGSVAGLAFYALDVVVIFPAAFPWFLDNDRLTQTIGHSIFGTITAAWLSGRRSI